jgi:hypothetical protein
MPDGPVAGPHTTATQNSLICTGPAKPGRSLLTVPIRRLWIVRRQAPN